MQEDVAAALRAVLAVGDMARPAVTAGQLRALVKEAEAQTGARVGLLADMTGGKSYYLNIIPPRNAAPFDGGGSRVDGTHDEMFVYISRFGPLALRYWNRYSALGEPTLYHAPPSPDAATLDATIVAIIEGFGVRFLDWVEADAPAPFLVAEQEAGARVGQLLFTVL